MARSMDYCKFRNAALDLHDIKTWFDETHGLDSLSKEEEAAYWRALEICKEIVENYA